MLIDVRCTKYDVRQYKIVYIVCEQLTSEIVNRVGFCLRFKDGKGREF